MARDSVLRTSRLLLRRWRESDRGPFAEMNADPEVARFLPAPLSRPGSDAYADKIEDHWARFGHGLWVLELGGDAPFVGFVGLTRPAFEAPFSPCVEVSWRLAKPFWGKGYATEATREALRHGFQDLKLDEVVSFTVPGNEPSRRLMKRLGMTRAASEDFAHPLLPPDHPLCLHVLYRLGRKRWEMTRVQNAT